MGDLETPAPVKGRHVWRGADLVHRSDWITGLPQAAAADLAGAVARERRRGRDSRTMDIDDHDFASLHEVAHTLRAALASA